MKKIFLTLVIITFALVMTILTSHGQGPVPRPRFEHLLTERHDYSDSIVSWFEVWHDREGGQEFICVRTDSGTHTLTCWPSGRTWEGK